MSDTEILMCIYPGCDRPAVPPHEMGGPQPPFCDSEEHNAATAHYARQEAAGKGSSGGEGGEASA